MNKKDFLFFNSHSKTKVNLSVYHVVLKKAVRIRCDNGKITPLSLEELSKEISNFISIEISGTSKHQYSENSVLLEQIFAELQKAQKIVPETLLQNYHEIITNAEETQSVKSLSLNESCLIFLLYTPRRGGDERIRVYHTELQRAVTISNNKDVSEITIKSLCAEITKQSTEAMEVHDVEEYLSNKALMVKVFDCLKKQSKETSDLSPVVQKEFHDLILSVTAHSLADLELEQDEE